jgi:hypothetical protein
MRGRDFSMSQEQWAAWFAERGAADLALLMFAIWDPIGVSDSAICAGEYEFYDRDVLAYVRDDDPAGLTEYFRRAASEAMGLSRTEPPEDAAQRVINGAYASAWLWAGRPLPGHV